MDRSNLTIREALEAVSKNLYVLPPIQREFVWDPGQVCRLFDRLMRRHPLGTFLFWMVTPEQSGRFKFYGFVQHYHERNAPHCAELEALPNQELTVVIEGQQRLTALNIGLRGSMAMQAIKKWSTSPIEFPRKFLHLDLLARRGEDQEGAAYSFQFKDPETATADQAGLWYPVHNIMTMANPAAVMQWLIIAFNQRRRSGDADLFRRARNTLHRLYEVVHIDPTITFHSEKSQELDRVVRIFIRMNHACSLTVNLVASLGLQERTLRAESELLPIAYYLFKRNPAETWLSAPASKAERDQIRSWLTRSS